jgi:Concanavalin A-like lectin/glucanases superfamily/WD40-like Beta Propeller Repeat
MKRTSSLVLVLTLGLIAPVANADFSWGAPTNPGPPVNSSYGESGVCISANGLEFYFASGRPGGYGGQDLWVMKRPTIEDDWGDPANLGSPANSQYGYWEPSISSDGLLLHFSDGHAPQFGNRLPGGLGGQGDIWMITRETVYDAWGAPVNIGPAVNSQHASHPSISADGLSLYFQSHRPGHLGDHCDIVVARRESTSEFFGNPVFLSNVNSADGEWMPDISADGLTLFFCRNSATEIWMATRPTVHDDFGAPLRLPPQINLSSYLNNSPCLSADGSILYFASDRPGGVGSHDLWQVSIDPIADFNGDGRVDGKDVLIMAGRWGEDDLLCDIGPMPWGDGIVDVRDVIALAKHIGEEVVDRTLVVHWTLDEIEGDIAYDSVGTNDATLLGAPVWEPEDGMVNGALGFDGLDDHMFTERVLDPAGGPFSVLAWITGGAPGQVIVSQVDGANWLMTDALEGALMTELSRPAGRTSPPALVSESLITDGAWHRVGLVWDGTVRALYTDGILVAEDTLSGLAGSDGGLRLGCAADQAPGTFFAGLIDDVRIYNRAVKP